MYEIWYQQIEEISARANAWCNFALVCGVIGLVLSVACAVWFVLNIKKEDK